MNSRPDPTPATGADDDELDAVVGDRPSAVPPCWTERHTEWTVAEIAAELGCDARTVRRWCDDGLIAAERTSAEGHYRVSGDALRTYLNGRPEPIAA
ncbi:MAG: hypothetical protein JWM10_991 [Myxococcaceae bacterium]|nr:hypothetical protein [Myxococcaceae bacterium]